MGDPYFPPNPDKIAEASIATRVAALVSSGRPRAHIAQELGISDSRLRTIMKSDECMRVFREITNHEKDMAKARVSKRANELIDACFDVIKKQLKKNNLRAVEITLKAAGVFEEFEQVSNNSKLVVVMPGASPPSQPDPIDVTPEKDPQNDF